jgi:ceramide glucosyltransferase
MMQRGEVHAVTSCHSARAELAQAAERFQRVAPSPAGVRTMTTALLALAVVAVVMHLVATTALVAVLRRRPRRAVQRRRVSILKPLKGLDDQLEENLESFFQLDHPDFELVFCAADPRDPALEVVERLRVREPHVRVRVVVGSAPAGLNPKVKVLARATEHARGDVLVVSDSNVRVAPSFLAETLSELDDPDVAIVSNLVSGVGERSIGATLENLQLDGFIAPAICLGLTLRATPCVVGKSMTIVRADLEAIGGWAALGDVLAEDYVLGHLLLERGRRAAICPHVVETVNERWTIGRFLERHGRWLKMRWRINPWALFVELASNVTLWSVLAAVASLGSPAILAAAAGLIACRTALDAVAVTHLRGHRPGWTALLLVPVRDLILAALWVLGIFSGTIRWRGGRTLVVGRKSRLSLPPGEVEAVASPRAPEREAVAAPSASSRAVL